MKPCNTGVMPSARSRARICFCKASWRGIQDLGNGPPQPSRHPIQPNDKKGGPAKKVLISSTENPRRVAVLAQTASWPVTDSGAFTPLSAIQSIKRSHCDQSYHGNE